MSIWDYSTTPGSNTSISGINIAPGCPSSSVGPAVREMLADTKSALIVLTAGGTSDAVTASLAVAPSALVDGMRVMVRAGAANATTTPTFQLNALGSAGTIKKYGGNALLVGDIAGAGHAIELEYVSSDNHWELLNPLASSPTSVWSTGDVKITLKTVADTGWVMFNDGTIGDASSGGTTRANADTVNLFELLWTNTANAQCPVSGGRGATAAADFAAHKTIGLPLTLGRALAVAGSGAGITPRALAEIFGSETQTLSQANLPNVNFTVTDPGHSHQEGVDGTGGATLAVGAIGNGQGASGPVVTHTGTSTTGITVASGGSGTSFGIRGPSSFFNVMVKL